jgi:hypothetical protein
MHLGRTSWWWDHVMEELLHLLADRKQSKREIGRGQGKI